MDLNPMEPENSKPKPYRSEAPKPYTLNPRSSRESFDKTYDPVPENIEDPSNDRAQPHLHNSKDRCMI